MHDSCTIFTFKETQLPSVLIPMLLQEAMAKEICQKVLKKSAGETI